MTTPLKSLAVSLLAVAGLAACHPVYVREPYRDDYGYAPGHAYGPAIAPPVVTVGPMFSPRPVIIEKTIIIKQRPPRFRHHRHPFGQ